MAADGLAGFEAFNDWHPDLVITDLAMPNVDGLELCRKLRAVSQVPITRVLVARLLKAYPGTIAGMKDSSGDWNNTAAMLADFGAQGFDVFCGSGHEDMSGTLIVSE